MDKFQIVELEEKKYDYLVIATSYENPLSNLEEVRKHLQLARSNVRLIFDLTLINGMSRNRYIKCNYNAMENNFFDFEIEKELDENVSVISGSYFQNNREIVESSVIPNALKFLILRKGII